MNIHFIAIGNRMPEWVQQGFTEYARRLPPECRLQLMENPVGKRGKGVDLVRLTKQEGRRIRAAIPKGAQIIAPGGCPRIGSLLRKSHFGPFSRSFSLNMNNYSPRMIEKMDSKWHSLATTSILEQPPGCAGEGVGYSSAGAETNWLATGRTGCGPARGRGYLNASPGLMAGGHCHNLPCLTPWFVL